MVWSRAKQGDLVTVETEIDKKSRQIDACCPIKTMVDIPPQLKTVGHVPRDFSRHIFFFLKEKNGKIDGIVYSTQYQPSPIPAGGLDIPTKTNIQKPTIF